MHELDCVCFDEVFRFDVRFMRRLVLQRNAIVVVAESDEGIVGFVIYEFSARTPDSAYVVTLDVHPDHRRAGLARTLMAEAERRAVSAGVQQIQLHVFTENEAAIRFYEDNEFKRIGVVKDFYGKDLHGFAYHKHLLTQGLTGAEGRFPPEGSEAHPRPDPRRLRARSGANGRDENSHAKKKLKSG